MQISNFLKICFLTSFQKQNVAEHAYIWNSPLKTSTRSKVMLKMSKSSYKIPKSGTEVLKLLYLQHSSFARGSGGRRVSDINATSGPQLSTDVQSAQATKHGI